MRIDSVFFGDISEYSNIDQEGSFRGNKEYKRVIKHAAILYQKDNLFFDLDDQEPYYLLDDIRNTSKLGVERDSLVPFKSVVKAIDDYPLPDTMTKQAIEKMANRQK